MFVKNLGLLSGLLCTKRFLCLNEISCISVSAHCFFVLSSDIPKKSLALLFFHPHYTH